MVIHCVGGCCFENGFCVVFLIGFFLIIIFCLFIRLGSGCVVGVLSGVAMVMSEKGSLLG